MHDDKRMGKNSLDYLITIFDKIQDVTVVFYGSYNCFLLFISCGRNETILYGHDRQNL